MKALGVKQLQDKKFKLNKTDGEWKGHLGDIPTGLVGIIYGDPGNGKTEYCIRLAKYLTKFDKVSWLSYEQGHDVDLQMALNRNNMEEVSGKFLAVDPLHKRKRGMTLIQELDEYLGRKSTPRFVFIDSVDYLRMNTDEYFDLKEKYGKRKAIIFISHATNGEPKSKTGRDILYDGKLGHFVKRFIVYPKKNRLGGTEDYIIWEEEARKRNPLYFKKKETADE